VTEQLDVSHTHAEGGMLDLVDGQGPGVALSDAATMALLAIQKGHPMCPQASPMVSRETSRVTEHKAPNRQCQSNPAHNALGCASRRTRGQKVCGPLHALGQWNGSGLVFQI
jgi:hypothetical protein